MPTLMTDCPKCDPCSPELDEDGRPYTCYFCCDTGRVPLAAVEEMNREQAEYDRTHPSPAPYVPPPRPLGPNDWDDDVPF